MYDVLLLLPSIPSAVRKEQINIGPHIFPDANQ